jgi:predicted aspartyl protease
LAKAGVLTDADLGREVSFRMANGSKSTQQLVRLASITIGGRTVYNVAASIAPPGSPPLLGQDFLRHFRSYTIDNSRAVLVLG